MRVHGQRLLAPVEAVTRCIRVRQLFCLLSARCDMTDTWLLGILARSFDAIPLPVILSPGSGLVGRG